MPNLKPFDYFLQKIKLLGIPKNSFTIFGSFPMYPLGLKYFFRDMDIVVRLKYWYKLAKLNNPTFKKKVISNTGLSFFEGKIEVFYVWKPGGLEDKTLWDTETLINTSFKFKGYNFVSLEKVLLYKKLLKREKDKADIKVIQDYLNNLVSNNIYYETMSVSLPLIAGDNF